MSKENKKKIIITGAGGFLGSNLVEALKGKGEYIIFALSSRGHQLQQVNATKNIQYCCKNIIFSNAGKQILNDSIVVNCAFPRNILGNEMADGLQYIQRLFCRLEECGAKAVVNISSQSVYTQERREPATEETIVSLESSYAVGKYATELMLESVCKKAEIPCTNLRMASLIGPGFDQRIVNRLVKRALTGEALQVVRSEQKFGFLDIEDAVKAITALLSTDIMQWKPIYNIGNGKEYSIEYIAQCIKHIFAVNGLSFPQVVVENGDGFGSTGVSYNMLHEDTGFVPSVDLNTSIQRILNKVQEDTR